MGLKRRNPARARLFTVPDVLAAMTALGGAAPVANVQTKAVDEAPKAPKPVRRQMTHEERHHMIAKVAYGHAERAGFVTDPLVNWLNAEREIDAELSGAPS